MGDLRAARSTSWHALLRDDDRGRRRRPRPGPGAGHAGRTGTTAIRTHVDLLPGRRPRCAASAPCSGSATSCAALLDLELVALAGPETPDRGRRGRARPRASTWSAAPRTWRPTRSPSWPGCSRSRARRGVGVDLHTDECLDGPVTLDVLARAVRGWRQPRVAPGTACRLGTLAARDAPRSSPRCSPATSASSPTRSPTSTCRAGSTRRRDAARADRRSGRCVDAGVRFAAGADNVRDPFNPLGRSDALETAMLLVVAGPPVGRRGVRRRQHRARATSCGCRAAGPSCRAPAPSCSPSAAPTSPRSSPTATRRPLRDPRAAASSPHSEDALPRSPPRRSSHHLPAKRGDRPVPSRPPRDRRRHGRRRGHRRSRGRCSSSQDVAMTFPDGTVALSGVDLTVGRGEFVTVVGPVRLRQVHPAADRVRPGDGERGHGRRWAPTASATSSRTRRCCPGAPSRPTSSCSPSCTGTPRKIRGREGARRRSSWSG